MADTEGWTPTDEDVERAVSAMWALGDVSTEIDARRALSTIGPIITRERRAAAVEALRAAGQGIGSYLADAGYWLRARADEIEREAS